MRRITRALLIAGLSAAAWTAWQATDDTAARAMETPPAAVQADNPIGSLIDDVETVVDEVVRPGRDEAPSPADDEPETPARPADPAPPRDPAPVKDAPTEPAPTSVKDAVDTIGSVLAPVVDPVVAPAVEPLPDLPAPAAPPVVDPTPRPTIDPAPTEQVEPTVDIPVTGPVDALVTTDSGVGPPVPTPDQQLAPVDLAPAAEEQCHHGRDRTADDAGDDLVMPPRSRGHHRRHGMREAPLRQPMQPLPPSDGVPDSALVPATALSISLDPVGVMPAGVTAGPRLGRGRCVRHGAEDTIDRERGVIPAPA